MSLRRGQVQLLVFAVSLVLLVYAVFFLSGSGGALLVATVFVSGCGVGFAATALIGATQREMKRVTPTRTPRQTRPRQTAPRPRRSERPSAEASTGRRKKGSRTRREPKQSTAVRTKGTVKWFNESKGFGFITLDDGGEDCFMHRSSIKSGDVIPEGNAVEFEIIKDDRGRRAAANVVEVGS